MNSLSWTQVLTWALSVFFLVAAVINTFATKVVGPEYRRWGYPDWFHFVSGGMELAVSLLLLSPETRLPGAVLGCGIMLAAIATVVYHREYRRAVPPCIVLVLLTVVASSQIVPPVLNGIGRFAAPVNEIAPWGDLEDRERACPVRLMSCETKQFISNIGS